MRSFIERGTFDSNLMKIFVWKILVIGYFDNLLLINILNRNKRHDMFAKYGYI